MPARGTLTLTQNSTAVTGNSSFFTTDLLANGFMVVNVGGTAYTLGIKSIESDTSLTLTQAFLGPTASGVAFDFVPLATLNLITSAIAQQVSHAIRASNLARDNWEQVLTKTGDVSVNLPDGSVYTGPAWRGIADVLTGKADKSDLDSKPSLSEVNTVRWKDAGDIRGWGAKCDGVTDDITAIKTAIAENNGRITIPADVFVSEHIIFPNITNFSIVCENNANIVIGTGFKFNPSYRGVVVAESCNGGQVIGVSVIGAKVDKTNADEPWQDGDAGFEPVNCTGTITIKDFKVKDVKTWAVIPVNCYNADFVIENIYGENCQVQSGIGGNGYRSMMVDGFHFKDIGLYAIESEKRQQRNKKTLIANGIIELCNKAIAMVHNTDNVQIYGVKVLNCHVGVSSTSDASEGEDYIGDGVQVLACTFISCKTAAEFIDTRKVLFKLNTTYRDDDEFYVRLRALDRIIKIDNGKAYVALDSATENPGIVAGMTIQFDDGKQVQVASVDSATSTDTNFDGPTKKCTLLGFTTSPAIDSKYLRSSFRRYEAVVTDKTGIVLKGGKDIVITENHFGNEERILSTGGDHEKLIYKNNTSANGTRIFDQISGGTVNGEVVIEQGENPFMGSLGSISKFYNCLNAKRTFSFSTQNDYASSQRDNAVPMPNGVVSSASLAVNQDVTVSGGVYMKVNGTDLISGIAGDSGKPKTGSGSVSSPIAVNGYATIKIVDTVGDFKTTGYAVELRGAFI